MGSRDTLRARRSGALLRAYRQRARLTQEQLAERSGVSVRTISNIEGDRAGTPRHTTMQSLADGLALDDGGRTRFFESVAPYERDERRSAASSSIAPMTRLIGRDFDVERIATILRERRPRLLTLTDWARIERSATRWERQEHSARSAAVPPAEAVDHLRHATALARSIGHQYTVQWCLSNFGAALFELGALTAALAAVDEAVEVAVDCDYLHASAHGRVSRCQILTMMFEIDVALDQLGDLRDDPAVLDDPWLTVRCRALSAICHALRGDVEQATVLARTATETAATVDRTSASRIAAIARGEVALAARKDEDAADHFRAAAAISCSWFTDLEHIHAVVGLALTSPRIDEAALALTATRQQVQEPGVTLPPLLQARMAAIDERWNTIDRDGWKRNLDQATGRPLKPLGLAGESAQK